MFAVQASRQPVLNDSPEKQYLWQLIPFQQEFCQSFHQAEWPTPSYLNQEDQVSKCGQSWPEANYSFLHFSPSIVLLPRSYSSTPCFRTSGRRNASTNEPSHNKLWVMPDNIPEDTMAGVVVPAVTDIASGWLIVAHPPHGVHIPYHNVGGPVGCNPGKAVLGSITGYWW